MTPYYQDDMCAVYHGDCREIAPVVQCDVVVTDPPYNIGYAYGHYDDDLPEEGYFDLLRSSFSASGARSILWFWQGRRVAAGHIKDVIPEGYAFHHLGGWYRKEYAGDIFATGHPAYCWEPIVWIAKPQKHLYRGPKGGNAARDMIGAMGSHREVDAKWFPCNKPVDAVRAAIVWCSEVGETVLDMFGGSGTTLKAALSLRRKAVMIELSEECCEGAARRIESYRRQISIEEYRNPVQTTMDYHE